MDAGNLSAERERDSPAAVSHRLLDAFEMADIGIAMMKENLRRSFPQANEADLERRLADWLRKRPGAELGDGEGKPVPWPR